MRRAWWGMLMVIFICFFGYWALYFKQYQENAVPNNADIIATVDVKNVSRKIIKAFLADPSRWTGTSGKPSKSFNWRKVFKIPDYLCLFHMAGQGGGNWYTRLKIKNRQKFNEAISLFHFTKKNIESLVIYSSAEIGVRFLVKDSEVIAATFSCSPNEVIQAGDDLFSSGRYLPAMSAKMFTNSLHDAVLLFRNGNYFKQQGTVAIDVNGGEVNVSGRLFPLMDPLSGIDIPAKGHEGILSLSLAPIPFPYLRLVPDSVVNKLTKQIGFPADSLFLNDRYNWQFNLLGFRQRWDTAINFEFDENFNEVQKSTIIKSTEPEMQITASGVGAENIFSMMQSMGLLEDEKGKRRFTGFPLWPVYANYTKGNFIIGNTTNAGLRNHQEDEIMHLVMHPSLIPDSLYRFVPDVLRPWLQKTKSIQVKLEGTGAAVKVVGEIRRTSGSYY